jgi:predicted transcriptional regulator
MADETNEPDLLALTADIVAEYAANNSIAMSELPGFIQSVHKAFSALGGTPEVVDESPDQRPAVTARKSLADPNFIISMIDGKRYTTLKRHLTGHGLTPAEYRERFGLKPDYPMTAPAYSERRSALAKAIGLGRKPGIMVPAKPARGRKQLQPSYS